MPALFRVGKLPAGYLVAPGSPYADLVKERGALLLHTLGSV
jgi:hypothetical protein